MRKTTKLAGTNDMAKITQMETSTSTDVVILRNEDVTMTGAVSSAEKGAEMSLHHEFTPVILTVRPATAAPW